MSQLKLGLLDHHLNTSHSTTFLKLLRGPLSEGVEIVGAWESSPEIPDGHEKHKLTKMNSAQEVIEASNAIMVLAPNNAEAHLELARPALEAGLPVYIDKSIADTVENAKEILRLSEKHNAPVMAASSLRFAVELDELQKGAPGPYESVFTRGMGKWNGYSVHTIAMALRLFGTNITRLIDTGTQGIRTVTLDDGNRRCTIEVREAENQHEASPWQAGVLVGDKYEVTTVKRFPEFYENMLRAALEFFRTGKSPVSNQEMIMSVAVEDAADLSLSKGGVWVDVG